MFTKFDLKNKECKDFVLNDLRNHDSQPKLEDLDGAQRLRMEALRSKLIEAGHRELGEPGDLVDKLKGLVMLDIINGTDVVAGDDALFICEVLGFDINEQQEINLTPRAQLSFNDRLQQTTQRLRGSQKGQSEENKRRIEELESMQLLGENTELGSFLLSVDPQVIARVMYRSKNDFDDMQQALSSKNIWNYTDPRITAKLSQAADIYAGLIAEKSAKKRTPLNRIAGFLRKLRITKELKGITKSNDTTLDAIQSELNVFVRNYNNLKQAEKSPENWLTMDLNSRSFLLINEAMGRVRSDIAQDGFILEGKELDKCCQGIAEGLIRELRSDSSLDIPSHPSPQLKEAVKAVVVEHQKELLAIREGAIQDNPTMDILELQAKLLEDFNSTPMPQAAQKVEKGEKTELSGTALRVQKLIDQEIAMGKDRKAKSQAKHTDKAKAQANVDVRRR